MARNRARCLRTVRVLQSYLDGALDELPARRVADHLEACRRCGLEAEIYRAIKASLSERNRPVDHVTLERLRRFSERLATEEEPTAGETGA